MVSSGLLILLGYELRQGFDLPFIHGHETETCCESAAFQMVRPDNLALDVEDTFFLWRLRQGMLFRLRQEKFQHKGATDWVMPMSFDSDPAKGNVLSSRVRALRAKERIHFTNLPDHRLPAFGRNRFQDWRPKDNSG